MNLVNLLVYRASCTNDLRIQLYRGPNQMVLTRSEAMALRDALALAIESHDTDEAHARMTSAYGGGR